MNGVWVAFEGPTGVGKTTVAQCLSEIMGWAADFGMDERNPFLDRFYGAGEPCALDMELWFLEHRHAQILQNVVPMRASNVALITDYHLLRNIVFSKFTLAGHEVGVFQSLFDQAISNCPQPDILVHLDASGQELHRRIRKRRRSYESGLSVPYLEKLACAFREGVNEFCSRRSIEAIRFNMDEIDICKNTKAIEEIKIGLLKALRKFLSRR